MYDTVEYQNRTIKFSIKLIIIFIDKLTKTSYLNYMRQEKKDKII